MESIKRERRVLKLVHPGRYIEVYRQPIIAAEVMRMNPRHCITRPDVFKFPWIVVKPESVLLPGSVFLIVPNHTIYDLLKATTQSNPSLFTQLNQSSNTHVHQQFKQDFHVSSYAGMSSTLQRHNQNMEGHYVRREIEGEGKLHIFDNFSLSHFPQRSHNCVSKTLSPDIKNMRTYDSDKRSQNQSYDELWCKVTSNQEDSQKKREILDESNFEFRPYYKAVQYYQNYSRNIGTEMLKKDVNIEFVSNEQITMLKSSLRRPGSMRKSLNFRVLFSLPVEKEKKLWDISH